jgi:uncharacterized protein YtpQ (UPF0354 family)
LAPPAEHFLDEWLGEGACAFRGGAEGLLALCRHMERWVYRDGVSEESERRFVEGAGALLGLLLIEHVGDARHAARAGTHRVRLGRFGYFDPFEAVDRALDAPDIRAELSRQVALAEAEAQARGPVSRLVSCLLQLIERERPDLHFEEQFDVSLSLRMQSGGERVEVDLRRAVDSTREQGSEAVERVAHKLLSMLPGAPEKLVSFGEICERLVPRITRADTLLELKGQAHHALFAAPLSAELRVALLIEYEGRARYVQQRELDAWELSQQAALECALTNLAARSQQSRLACTETEYGPLLVARTGDGRDSARVLLKSLYYALTERLGERVCVGVPHRDTFFACSAESEALLRELSRRTAHDAERAPHRLSAQVFELSADGFRVARVGPPG